jgi:NADPH:quinone reductase-like Zn-dependent oxidoreductase
MGRDGVPTLGGMADSPEVMTAAVTTAHGGPEVIEIRHDWPRPEPGPGQALVRVAAAAVNNTDLWSRRGAYGTSEDPDAVAGWRGVPLDFPLIQGGDVAGTVVAVGDPPDAAWVGRRVIVDPAAEYTDDRPTAVIGSEVDGGFAGFHVSAVERLYDVTESPLSDAQLACLPIAYATALGMVQGAGCTAGERVLVTGASGGVGLAAVQIAAARGCHVIGYTSAGKAEAVREAGADETLLRDRDSLGDIDEVDAVLDVVGGPEFGSVFDRLRDGGRLATVGAIAGPVVDFDLRRLYLRHRRLIGSTMHTPQLFAGVAELARTGAVMPRVAATYDLSDIVAAQERFERKDFVGKLVLIPDPG